MRALWKFDWDCYNGHVLGVFVATDEEVAAAIGEEIYFGEILGKHSEIAGVLEQKDLTRVTDDADFIARAEQLGVANHGYNPLKYRAE